MSQINNVEQTKPSNAKYLSKYGMMRHSYLEEHQPDLYAELLRDGELKSHCLEVQTNSWKSAKKHDGAASPSQATAKQKHRWTRMGGAYEYA